MRILLIEDEKKIANFIQRGLKEEHYIVDAAVDGEEGAYLAEINPYDLIILDVMLPKKDGMTVCRELREKKITTPILMLTARDALRDKVSGFNAGADDYLTKPFAFEEFLVRVKALLRRQRSDKTDILKVADLELDQRTHKIKRANKPISLTSKEYALLEFMMVHANEVVTRTMISEHVWHEDFDTFTNVIDVYVKYLRTKVDTGHAKKLIYTIRGVGYSLKDPASK